MNFQALGRNLCFLFQNNNNSNNNYQHIFSFNRICELENLDSQTSLKVLAIFNNNITQIKNIHHMQKLGT